MRWRLSALIVLALFAGLALYGAAGEPDEQEPVALPTPSTVDEPTLGEIQRAAMRLAEAVERRGKTDDAVAESAEKMLER